MGSHPRLSVSGIKMSLLYPAGAGTAALGVVGLYMLFNGEGERFNV